jgi:hypothetical protein
MVRRSSSLVFVLLSCLLWAQHPDPKQAEDATIERVKTWQVSSLDRDLPNVTLEFFLKYEGEGAPIKWRTSHCDQLKGNPVTDGKRDPGACVEAEVDLKDNRSATVVVSTGTSNRRAASIPIVFSVTITDQNGRTHDVRRLSELPMELHRPPQKSPRDLPLPVGAA